MTHVVLKWTFMSCGKLQGYQMTAVSGDTNVTVVSVEKGLLTGWVSGMV